MDKAYLKSIVEAKNLDDDKKIELAKILDLVSFCYKKHKLTFSEFYDPVSVSNFITALKPLKDIKILSFGGLLESERKIIGFSPDYNDFCVEDFPISIVKLTYSQKFDKPLNHSDYLGSLMGLQIERAFIGDILTFDGGAYVFVKDSMADYICSSVVKVGRSTVEATIVLEIEDYSEKKQTVRVNISSLRLDSFVSVAFKLSRSKAAQLIESGKVFLNWCQTDSTSKFLKQDDVISARGFGRVRVIEIVGETKKGRLNVLIDLYR